MCKKICVFKNHLRLILILCKLYEDIRKPVIYNEFTIKIESSNLSRYWSKEANYIYSTHALWQRGSRATSVIPGTHVLSKWFEFIMTMNENDDYYSNFMVSPSPCYCSLSQVGVLLILKPPFTTSTEERESCYCFVMSHHTSPQYTVAKLVKSLFKYKSSQKVRKFVKDKNTHKRKSCSQHGVGPLTVTVVDLTFWSLSVTYVLNCVAANENIL
jgi:hypothetical protein